MLEDGSLTATRDLKQLRLRVVVSVIFLGDSTVRSGNQHDPATIRALLRSLGLPTEAPDRAPPSSLAADGFPGETLKASGRGRPVAL